MTTNNLITSSKQDIQKTFYEHGYPELTISADKIISQFESKPKWDRVRRVASFVSTGQRVLDIGCGHGRAVSLNRQIYDIT